MKLKKTLLNSIKKFKTKSNETESRMTIYILNIIMKYFKIIIIIILLTSRSINFGMLYIRVDSFCVKSELKKIED